MTVPLPEPVAVALEHRLGAPVLDVSARPGGFSGGVRGVAAPAGGRRVFVKAIREDSEHAGDYRSEAMVSAALPAAVPSDLGDADPQQIFVAHPVGRDADPDRVDALLVALAGYWTRTAALPGPPHAPHLRDRRERARGATTAWLAHRWS
ncbi:hypothetical protein ABT294_37280 [Nonomuraea sp. NPDC000554]|uniref:hypothetical protein n=1 Tax=Nonomuraea sp. NPDC000554 TaxID=3154259 RepID=UPI003325194F